MPRRKRGRGFSLLRTFVIADRGFWRNSPGRNKDITTDCLGVPYPSHPSSPKNQCSQELHICFYSKGRSRRTLVPCWPYCDLGHMPSHVQARICSPGRFSVAPLSGCGEGWCGTEFPASGTSQLHCCCLLQQLSLYPPRAIWGMELPGIGGVTGRG